LRAWSEESSRFGEEGRSPGEELVDHQPRPVQVALTGVLVPLEDPTVFSSEKVRSSGKQSQLEVLNEVGQLSLRRKDPDIHDMHGPVANLIMIAKALTSIRLPGIEHHEECSLPSKTITR